MDKQRVVQLEVLLVLEVQVVVQDIIHLTMEIQVKQFNQLNQVIQVLMVLEILAVTDFTHHLQQVLKVVEAEVPAVAEETLDQITLAKVVQVNNTIFQVQTLTTQVADVVVDIQTQVQLRVDKAAEVQDQVVVQIKEGNREQPIQVVAEAVVMTDLPIIQVVVQV